MNLELIMTFSIKFQQNIFFETELFYFIVYSDNKTINFHINTFIKTSIYELNIHIL